MFTGEMYSLVKSRSEFTRCMHLANNNKRCTDVGHTHSEDTSCIMAPYSESTSKQRRTWTNVPSNEVNTSIKCNNLIA